MQLRDGEGLDPWPLRTASVAVRAEGACAGGSRRRQTSIGRWTRPKPHTTAVLHKA